MLNVTFILTGIAWSQTIGYMYIHDLLMSSLVVLYTMGSVLVVVRCAVCMYDLTLILYFSCILLILI